MNKSKAAVLIAIAAVLVASACLVTLPAPASLPATQAPDLGLTGMAQTLTAAPTFTQAVTPVLDTATPTLTLTPFPSITPLPTATATFTETPFGFVPSPTLGLPPPGGEVETPDPAEGATNDWGSDYRCTLISKEPSDWMTLAGKTMYRASWILLNSGKKGWQADGVILTYLEGPKLATEKTISLHKDVDPGDQIKAAVNIVAPKEPGKYRSVWAMQLKRSGQIFCTFTIKITVP
jgi:hypothetical protein